jgi:ABC-type phosphate transport system auxiliary subunit
MSPLLIPIFGMMIPIAAFCLVAFKSWIKLKERQLEVTGNLTAEKTAQYAAHTERLEQRVRVLERIVTDRGLALTEEIESLRLPRDH